MTYLDQLYRTDGTGRTATTTDLRIRVRSLLEAVLFTAPGERVNRPEFGSGIRDMLFDSNSEALETASDFLIRAEIQRHLSDVVVLDALEVTRNEGELRISLSYTPIGSDERIADTFAQEVG